MKILPYILVFTYLYYLFKIKKILYFKSLNLNHIKLRAEVITNVQKIITNDFCKVNIYQAIHIICL
jgi:hypothetical protein